MSKDKNLTSLLYCNLIGHNIVHTSHDRFYSLEVLKGTTKAKYASP